MHCACLAGLIFCFLAGPAEADLAPIETTPKLEILDQQILMNPSDSQAFANRGYTLALLGRKDEAREDLRKAVEIKNTAPTHNRVGWAYFNMGDYPDALREFETAADLRPPARALRLLLARARLLGHRSNEGGFGELSARG